MTSHLSESSESVDERWYELGLALVAEGFERPRMVDDELRERLKRVLRRTYSEDPSVSSWRS